MKDHKIKKARLDPEVIFMESMIEVREKRGLTQAEMARRMEVKQPALSRWERTGFEKAKVKTLKKIARALDAELIVKLQVVGENRE